MPYRVLDQAMLLEPQARSHMQGLDVGRRQLPPQLGLQQLLKHVVVTKPLIRRIERDTEQPFALQRLHERAAVELARRCAFRPAHRVHELGTEALENGGL